MFIQRETPIKVGGLWVNTDPRNAGPKGGTPLTVRIVRRPTLSVPATVQTIKAPKHLAHLIGRQRLITATALRTNYRPA